MQTNEAAEEIHGLKARFLAHYRECGIVTMACEAAGIGRRQRIYEWQEHDDQFSRACQEARVQATERLEQEARRRAVEGFERPVYQGGKLVGVERTYSDTLLVLMLKANAPEKYRERVDVRQSGAPDVGDTLTVEQREAIRRVLVGA